MKLVPDWRRAPKWFTVRLAALVMLLSSLQLALPKVMTELPPKIYHWLVFGLGVAIAIGRVILQGDAPAPAPAAKPGGVDNPG